MKIALLWTDQCFLLVLILSGIALFRGMRKAHIKRAFQSIFKGPIAVSTGIILSFFLTIAALDSIRFQTIQTMQPISVLDQLLSPLDHQYEKTYSAPFALHLYSTETVIEHGVAKQIYPRLRYLSPALQSKQDVFRFVTHVIFQAIGASILMTAAVWLVLVVMRRLVSGKVDWFVSPAGLSGFATLCLCLSVLMAVYWLSRDLHVLGTGKIGQDEFYYAVKSIRTGLIIGTLTTLFMMPLALLLGISAGYFGGLVDDVIQYVYTTLSSIPGVLLITASVLSMQTYIANHPEQFTTLAQTADARLLALCFILGITSWTSLCRLLRAETLKLREIDFVLAAQALGSRSFTIIRKHLLPNVMHIVLITLALDFSFLVLAEAVLSYVGVGVSPMTMSWGNMINSARLELAREPIVWWPMLAAFLFMFTLVLAGNLFADAVRDAFDPRAA